MLPQLKWPAKSAICRFREMIVCFPDEQVDQIDGAERLESIEWTLGTPILNHNERVDIALTEWRRRSIEAEIADTVCPNCFGRTDEPAGDGGCTCTPTDRDRPGFLPTRQPAGPAYDARSGRWYD